jgi:hypothetical protein
MKSHNARALALVLTTALSADLPGAFHTTKPD